MIKGVLVWREEGSIPAAAEKYFRMKIREEVGLPIRVHSINLENNTRPKTDPRPCFCWKGYMDSDHGNSTTDGLLAVGYACSYGNVVRNLHGMPLTRSDMLGFKFLGEVGDDVKACVIYEVVDE